MLLVIMCVRRMKTLLTATIIFALLSSLVAGIQAVEDQSYQTITIKPDGSAEGTDKIQRDGDIYILTDNITNGIVVEKDNIVIDGAGYTIKGDGNTRGINLANQNYVTIKNLVIVNFSSGIYCSATGNNSFLNNYIIDCEFGIDFLGSSDNLIKYNTFKNNSIDISICYTRGGTNVITQNSIDSYIQVWISDQPVIDMNYWTDYNGTDNDGDGIGDSAYFYHDILKDSHPLIEPVPVIPEFPLWTFLVAGVFAVTVLSIIYRRGFKEGRKK